MNEEPIRFLDKGDEKILLALPWVGIALFVAFYFFQPSHTFVDLDLVGIACGILFLDSIHVTFTLIIIKFVPELGPWTRDERAMPAPWMNKFSKNFWMQILIIGFALGALYYSLNGSHVHRLTWLVTFYTLIEAFGPAQHTMAQTKGISFCFNSVLRKSVLKNPIELEQATQIENVEKMLFLILLIGDAMAAFPNILQMSRITFPGQLFIERAGLAIVFGAAVGIYYNGRQFPQHKKSRKSQFLSRVFLFPLRVFLPTSNIVIRATHGTEYFLIMRQMMRNSNISQPMRRRIYKITLGISLAYGAIFISTTMLFNLLFNVEPSKPYVFCATLFTFAVRYLHFYMDRQLYRMKNPVTRQVVAPLLVGKTAQSQTPTLDRVA